jgi:polygalacturonase
MASSALLLLVLLVAASATLARSTGPTRAGPTINIAQHGGVGDNRTSNTHVFKSAVATVAAAGGGTVVVPRGVFITGPFNLTSRMTLYLEAGATILGSTDLAEWPLMPAMPSCELSQSSHWLDLHR